MLNFPMLVMDLDLRIELLDAWVLIQATRIYQLYHSSMRLLNLEWEVVSLLSITK